jgi:hypothetical protein
MSATSTSSQPPEQTIKLTGYTRLLTYDVEDYVNEYDPEAPLSVRLSEACRDHKWKLGIEGTYRLRTATVEWSTTVVLSALGVTPTLDFRIGAFRLHQPAPVTPMLMALAMREAQPAHLKAEVFEYLGLTVNRVVVSKGATGRLSRRLVEHFGTAVSTLEWGAVIDNHLEIEITAEIDHAAKRAQRLSELGDPQLADLLRAEWARLSAAAANLSNLEREEGETIIL